MVLLVHADRLGDLLHVAERVGHRHVEVDDLAETVTAQGEGVRVIAEVELPGVEGLLAQRSRGAVAVGDHELGDRHAVGNRPLAAGIVESHVVKHKSLTLVEADAQPPALPAHTPAIDRERRAVLLHDGEVAQSHVLAGLVGPVGAGRQRDRRGAFVILHAQDLAGVEVDDGAQALDRVRVDVGVGLGL